MRWLRPDGEAMEDGDWHDPETRALAMQLADRTNWVTLLFNSHHEAIDFTLRGSEATARWRCSSTPDAGTVLPEAGVEVGRRREVAGRAPHAARHGGRGAMSAATGFGGPGAPSVRRGRRASALGARRRACALRLAGGRPCDGRSDDGWFELTRRAGRGAAMPSCSPTAWACPTRRRARRPATCTAPRCSSIPRLRWRARLAGRPWEEAVIYELHVGAFTPEGTFRGGHRPARPLVGTGFTAIEIMPVAQFAGDRGWGYDGVLPYAPHPAYGTPDDLKALVDAAHERGLMVLLDVVYNHFGPDGNYLGAYAPDFFHAERHTPWGAAIAYERAPVRRFFIDNALYWLEEFRFDGLRLDAIDQIRDPESPVELLVEIGPSRPRGAPGPATST